MRTISNLPIPQNTQDLPLGGIVNETDTQDGTPVIEEIYGDVLSNLYRLLTLTGITPTNTQDNDVSQYQLVEALQKLPNVLNDIQQPLTLSGAIWSVPIDIDALPDNYFIIARAANDYVSGIAYTFQGSGNDSFSFTSSGFNANANILLILNSLGVRAISLDPPVQTRIIYPNFANPLPYNDSNTIYYNANGALLTDTPSAADLIAQIRVSASNVNLQMIEMFVTNGRVLCVVFDNLGVVEEYFLYDFAITNLTSPRLLTFSGFTPPTGAAILSIPVFYLSGTTLYVSNSFGENTIDAQFRSFTYDTSAGTLTALATVTLSGYIKTTNGAILNGLLYTLVNNQLNTFNVSTGVQSSLATYQTVLGQLFFFGSGIYYNTGEVAKQWFVP